MKDKNQKFLNKITHGNSLEILPQIENNSVDIVLTDPPYFLDKMDESWDHKVVSNKNNQQTVKSLPAGMKFSREQGVRFYKWYFKISKEAYRVLKPGGFFFSFSSPRLYHRMASAADDANFEIRDCFLWVYTQNQPKAMSLDHFINKLKENSETKKALKKKLAGWKTPQIRSCFEPIMMAQKSPGATFLKNIIKNEIGLFNTQVRVGENMFPTNILTVNTISEIMDKNFLIKKPNKKEKGNHNLHMTVKPLCLCEHLIKLSAFSKDAVILDPFVGSGTTAIAAQNLKKNFIGIDSNYEYVKVARNRLRSSINKIKKCRKPQEQSQPVYV